MCFDRTVRQEKSDEDADDDSQSTNCEVEDPPASESARGPGSPVGDGTSDDLSAGVHDVEP